MRGVRCQHMCWACVGHVLGMCWARVGHVLGMCWARVGHVLGMCWACQLHVRWRHALLHAQEGDCVVIWHTRARD
jgi:uncharacterized membrane protein YeaQ/YmgE (transglycosylase-associated protein family)